MIKRTVTSTLIDGRLNNNGQLVWKDHSVWNASATESLLISSWISSEQIATALTALITDGVN